MGFIFPACDRKPANRLRALAGCEATGPRGYQVEGAILPAAGGGCLKGGLRRVLAAQRACLESKNSGPSSWVVVGYPKNEVADPTKKQVLAHALVRVAQASGPCSRATLPKCRFGAP